MPTFDKIKTPSQLKAFAENNESYFFVPKTMRAFGDTVRNYGIRHHTLEIGHVIELYRRKPVKHDLATSAYWRVSPNHSDCAQLYSRTQAEIEIARKGLTS